MDQKPQPQDVGIINAAYSCTLYRAKAAALSAANCPVAATEVLNSIARSTKSGPNITITVKVKKTVAERNISNALGDKQVFSHTFALSLCKAVWR